MIPERHRSGPLADAHMIAIREARSKLLDAGYLQAHSAIRARKLMGDGLFARLHRKVGIKKNLTVNGVSSGAEVWLPEWVYCIEDATGPMGRPMAQRDRRKAMLRCEQEPKFAEAVLAAFRLGGKPAVAYLLWMEAKPKGSVGP
mgnify:CR=1 FL=1